MAMWLVLVAGSFTSTRSCLNGLAEVLPNSRNILEVEANDVKFCTIACLILSSSLL